MMRTSAVGLLVLLLAVGAVSAETFSKGRWIDLTHEFSSETVYWPTSESFSRETVFEGITDAGYYYSAYTFRSAEHGGTHIDAPIHFAEGQRTVDEIPVEQLIGPVIVVDVARQAAKNRDYQVTVGDFLDWERSNGRLPSASIVLLRTGFGRYWPDKRRYMGTDARGTAAVGQLHFPGLHPETARWLVAQRSINAVGLDTPSIDYGQSTLFESHRILFEANIPAFENVANMEALPLTGATVIALPMKIKGGSGGPLRIVAFVPAER